MTDRVDDLLGPDLKLYEEGDEWAEGPSDDSDVRFLWACSPGEIRRFPWAGANMVKFMNAKYDRQAVARAIEVALEYDGHEQFKITLGAEPGDIKIEV